MLKTFWVEKWHPKRDQSRVLRVFKVVTNWYSFGNHSGYLKGSKINLFGIH